MGLAGVGLGLVGGLVAGSWAGGLIGARLRAGGWAGLAWWLGWCEMVTQLVCAGGWARGLDVLGWTGAGSWAGAG